MAVREDRRSVERTSYEAGGLRPVLRHFAPAGTSRASGTAVAMVARDDPAAGQVLEVKG